MEGEQGWRTRIERDRKHKEEHCSERQMVGDGWQRKIEQSPSDRVRGRRGKVGGRVKVCA